MSELIPALKEYNYIPTMEDLNNIFPLLPPPDKINSNVIKIPVQVIAKKPDLASEHLIIEMPAKTEIVGHIRFDKFMDNGKSIWIYEGIVKYK